jgi:uncharacterized protein DUF748
MAIARRSDSAAERLPVPEWAPAPRPRRRPVRAALRITGIALLTLLGLIVLALIGLNLAEDSIREYAEAVLNDHVPGYQFTLGRLDLHPLGLSLDLENLTVVQEANPDPPVAHIPRYRASLQWSQVLRGNVVSDHTLERPVFHFTRPQAKKAAQETKEVVKEAVAEAKAKKWQDAIMAIYPVTINEFKIERGAITYVDGPGASPLKLTDLNLQLGNVRNVRSEAGTYPSPIHLDASFGRAGRITIDGKTDLLAEPLPDVDTDLRLESLEVGRLRPIAARFNLYLGSGTLSAEGHLRTDPDKRLLALRELTLDGVHADYILVKKASPVQKAGEKVAEAAAKGQGSDGNPATIVKIAKGQITKSEFGVVQKAAQPEYRVFLTDVDARMTNLSNRPADGIGSITLKGKFMGSGDTQVRAAFRPETKSPDFDLNLRIENTRLPTMNELLRAHGKFDVAKGRFSLYSELMVRDGQVQGYIKPLFQDMEVYDAKQDRNKPVLKKLYEGVIGGISGLLQNRKTDTVATKADVSGPLEKPDMNTWEVLGVLFRNAFARAVLPGYDRGKGGG